MRKNKLFVAWQLTFSVPGIVSFLKDLHGIGSSSSLLGIPETQTLRPKVLIDET